MKLFLQKNEKRTEENKQPYFRLVLPPEQEGGKWITIGAFWKSKNGNGYTGKLDDKIARLLVDDRETVGNPPYEKDKGAEWPVD